MCSMSEAELEQQGKCLRMSSEREPLADLKIIGLIPTPAEERIQMMVDMGISKEKAQELLQTFEARKR